MGEESAILFRLLNSSSKWLILSIVYSNPGLSGRKISHLSGMGWVPIHNSLKELYQHRFILRQKVGKSYLYFPNEKHIFFPILKRLFQDLEKIHTVLYYDLQQKFKKNDQDLLALKLTASTLYLITRSECRHLREEVELYLAERGLGFMDFELIPFTRLDHAEYRHLSLLPGKVCGLPLLQLLKLI
ncbi:MAG: hypothetical protein DSZ24_01695 [Thermodesulfatator sp.]|nr:MAG: hypothetical protein DSZ24_01695 [Thermodesulfatator sp.]